MRGAHGQPTNSSGAGRAHPERMGRNAGVERKLRCAVLGARAELSQGAKHGLAPPASDRRLIGHEVRKHDCRRAAGWTGKLHRCSVFRWHSLARRQVHAHCLGSCGSGAIGVGAGLGRCPDPVVAAGAPAAVSAGGLKYWKSGACCSSSLVQATFSLMLVGSLLPVTGAWLLALAAGTGSKALMSIATFFCPSPRKPPRPTTTPRIFPLLSNSISFTPPITSLLGPITSEPLNFENTH